MTRHLATLSAGIALCALASAMTLAAGPGWECLPGGDGRLQMGISGDFEAKVDWGNEGTRCEGGPRPAGDALRLMFSRDDDGLLVVIGITGLARGATGEGLLANVTVVRQGLGRFYGTLGADACVVEVEENSPVAGLADAWRVSGQGYCAAGIEAIAREGEIRIAPFAFTGLAFWPDEPDED
jgi:hypothetical protein